jgi:hypothetical protein
MKRKAGEVRTSTAFEKGENTRVGTTVASITQAIFDNLHCVQVQVPALATREYCDNIWKVKPLKK